MQRICRLISFCALLAALVGKGLCAEPKADLRDFAIHTWGSAEGLPDNPVTAIVQTRDGFLWIGTSAGLFRFDGLVFKPISLSSNSTNATLSITSLCEDNSGRLWIGTETQGAYCWQNGTGRHFGTNEGLLDQNVTSLALDSEGCVWIGTLRGACRSESGRFTLFTRAQGLQEDAVINVYAARSGRVWITTAGGTCQYVNGKLEKFHFPSGDNPRNQEFLQIYEDRRGNLWGFCSTYLINLADEKRINYFPGEKSGATCVWNLCEGRNGRLWIAATGRGLFCFDGTKFQPVTLNEGRWPNDVRTIYEDHEGNLWLGISGVGLVQLRAQTFTLLTENRGLPPGPATSVTTDSSGKVFVGMESGGIYEMRGDHFEPISPEDHFLGQELAACLCANPDGTIWAGTDGSGLFRINDGKIAKRTTANGLEDNSITSLCGSADSSIWVGTKFGAVQKIAQGVITSFAQVNGVSGRSVTALLALPRRGIWIGTSSGELLRAQNDFKTITTAELPQRLAGRPILSLCASTNDALWIATDGGGLGYLKGEVRRAWSSQDGLPDNVVLDMVEDGEGNLWLATPKGLCRISSDSLMRALNRSEPLKTKLVYETDQSTARALRFCGPHAVRSADGKLWFALNSGLIGVNIRGRDPERPAPRVHIEGILVDDSLIAEGAATGSSRPEEAPAVLPANLKTLEFRFTGLSFDAPEKVRFRHKMDGIDVNWVQDGTERQVAYGRLPSGNYVFHVTACNAEGIWNEKGTQVAIVIPPPFWHTPLALGTGGFMAIMIVVGTVRVVSHRRLRSRLELLKQQQAMERERIRIAQNMHDEIGSKLTKISYLSERARTEVRGGGMAEGKIDSIATTSRELLKALDEIVWAVNPKNDTLEHLAAYFCQYAREYFQETTVECDLRIQSKLPEVEMTAETRHNLFLAFEESLNNVLKHAKASRLKMDISTDAQVLRITIRDNGAGFSPPGNGAVKATGGNGLRNLRQRMTAVGGTCVIESSPGGGTCISLSVPLDFEKIRNR